MTDVGLVVLDEVHYLGDPDRGSVWEEVIISCPQSVPLICMSATVRNPGDLGGWITKVSLWSLPSPYCPSRRAEVFDLLKHDLGLWPLVVGEGFSPS